MILKLELNCLAAVQNFLDVNCCGCVCPAGFADNQVLRLRGGIDRFEQFNRRAFRESLEEFFQLGSRYPQTCGGVQTKCLAAVNSVGWKFYRLLREYRRGEAQQHNESDCQKREFRFHNVLLFQTLYDTGWPQMPESLMRLRKSCGVYNTRWNVFMQEKNVPVGEPSWSRCIGFGTGMSLLPRTP